MKSLMSVALIVSLLAPASVPPPARANCRSDFAGIAYCVEDGGATQLFVIDLTNPHIRLQTVMANDVLDVRPPDNQREQVSDMARRYRNEGVVLAINGDYFGADRGPEGPTVVQGQRLDSLVTVLTNPSHYRRTTLALSRTGAASIGYIDPRASFAPLVYREVI